MNWSNLYIAVNKIVMKAACKNCETIYIKDYKYCPECSQKTQLHRLTFNDIIHEAIHYFTHVDKGIFQLIRDLLIKRGLVAYEYIEGKRKKYFPPLNFFLLIATVFLIAITQFDHQTAIDTSKKAYEFNSKIQDPIIRQEAFEIYERSQRIGDLAIRYSNLIAIFSLPLTALIFWLFYHKTKYNYIEHLIAGMYMQGICILISSLVILPLALLFDFEEVELMFFTVQLFYFAVFYYGFLKKTKTLQFLKALGVSLVNVILWNLIVREVVSNYVKSGYGGLLH